MMPGSGSVTLTGKLGDVIKESVQTALSWIRSHASQLGISSASSRNALIESSSARTTSVSPSASLLTHTDLHVHFPHGAVPKDGPSAGVAVLTALVSLLLNRPVAATTAMTGEITLRGLVLPVGGIKEKVLAAHRGGVRRVLLPAQNRKQVVQDIPESVLKDLEVIYISTMAEALNVAFEATICPPAILPMQTSKL